MTDRIDPASLTDPRDLAAYWYERSCSGDLTDAEHRAFTAWQRIPENAEHYTRVAGLWQMATALPKQPASQSHADDHIQGQRSLTMRRRAMMGLGAIGAALVVLTVMDHTNWLRTPSYESLLTTAHGQRKEVVLPDDSVLLLNTDTVAVVRYFNNKRTVQLSRGEILFKVDGTKGTPFIVDADIGTVRVTGTQFHVRREDQTLNVGVLEGQVKLNTGPWWRFNQTILNPGNAAAVDAAGHVQLALSAAVDNSVAWRDGKVVFRGTALSDVVRELNRYSSQRLVVRDTNTARLKISGVFSIDDLSGFVSQLPKIVPVMVRRQPDGQVIDILPL